MGLLLAIHLDQPNRQVEGFLKDLLEEFLEILLRQPSRQTMVVGFSEHLLHQPSQQAQVEGFSEHLLHQLNH